MSEFTHRMIEAIKPDPDKAAVEYFDSQIKGLGLRVTARGSKTFFYRYRLAGRLKRYTIGSFPAVKLADARNEAMGLKLDVSAGLDPQVDKQNRRRSAPETTFADLCATYKELHLIRLRQRTREEHSRIIDKELVPALGKIPIIDVSRGHIMDLLDRKAIRDKKPTMANRIRARVHSIFEFGVHRGVVSKNPVTNIKAYPEGEVRRERFYSEAEIRELWAAFHQLHQPAASVLKILLLTGQRKTETMHMRWSDIKGDIWTIPAELAKGKRSHEVPLSKMALEVIEVMKIVNGSKTYVFNSPTKPDAPVDKIKGSVKRVRDELTTVKDFRLHDLRRTAATYMARLGTDRTTLGKLLNHKGLSGDGQVTAIYDRHSYLDEKRAALERWAAHLERIITGGKAKVIGRIGS